MVLTDAARASGALAGLARCGAPSLPPRAAKAVADMVFLSAARDFPCPKRSPESFERKLHGYSALF